MLIAMNLMLCIMVYRAKLTNCNPSREISLSTRISINLILSFFADFYARGITLVPKSDMSCANVKGPP